MPGLPGDVVTIVAESARAAAGAAGWAASTGARVHDEVPVWYRRRDQPPREHARETVVLSPGAVEHEALATCLAVLGQRVVVVRDPDGGDAEGGGDRAQWFVDTVHLAGLHDRIAVDMARGDLPRGVEAAVSEEGEPLGRLPNLMIVGAQKSGTTWLHRALGKSAQVFSTDVKELTHFNQRDALDEDRLREYRGNFPVWSDAAYLMESTPHYFRVPSHDGDVDVAANIDAVLPDVRLVVMLRNPVDRYESAYIHHMMQQRIDYVEEITEVTDYMSMVSLGNYATILRHWQDRFPDIHVIVYDDVVADPSGVVDGVFEWLEIDRDVSDDDLMFRTNDKRRKNKRLENWDVMPRLSQATRDELRAVYADEVRELGAMLGRDLTGWLAD